MKTLKKVAIELTGNTTGQRALEKVVYLAQSLMGVGYGRSVFSSGEKGPLQLLRRMPPSRLCIVDVGSNKGQYLKLALEVLVGYDLDIHCFEPSLSSFTDLTSSFGGRSHVHLNNFALGKEEENKVLYSPENGSTSASLIQRKLSNLARENKLFIPSERVHVKRLDCYCKEKGIQKIHLLKVDVEGFEMDVVRGAGGMFSQGNIDIVTFEFGAHQIERRVYFHDFYRFFSRRHMKLYRITPSGYLHPIENYKPANEQYRTSNFVAIREGMIGF